MGRGAARRRGSGPDAQALQAPLFWTIAVPFALALAAQVGFIVHQISLLTPALGEARAALAVSATTVAALIGRLGFGLLADQWDPRVLSAWNIGIQAAALAAMAARPTPVVLYAGSLVVGLAVGNMITLPPILTREEFGSHVLRHHLRHGERREPGGPRVRPRPDRADPGHARELSAGALGPGRAWKCSPSPACSGAGRCEGRACLYLRGNCGPSGRRPS